MIDLTDGATQELSDLSTSRQVSERLNASFPGYLWAVHCQWRQGILIVRNLSVSAKYGFVIKLLPIASASELEALAVKAGGEILERFRLSRRRFDGDEYDSMAMDFAGMAIGDTAR